MSIPKPLDKELLLVLLGMILNNMFDLVSRSRSISIDRTRISMCPGEELVIWILQPGSQKRSMDCDEAGVSKVNLDHIVVSCKESMTPTISYLVISVYSLLFTSFLQYYNCVMT